MTIPDVQTPVENSFDAAADLMIGKATKTYNSLSEAKADAIPLLWQRIVSHADITLKGLQGLTENEVITTIVLTADADAKLVGDRWIDIQNGNILGPKPITNANILTINGTNLKVNENNVEFWAAVMPATVKSLNIAVETNKATYTRNIESCNIEFKQNARKGLNVDMSKVERVEKSAGLALPFVDDFSWSTTAKNETDFSNNIKEKSNNKYTEAYKLYTPKSDGEIRIGIRDEPGYISTCALDLSKDFYVEVEAKAYNTDDNARISISVDNGTPLKAGEALTNDYGTYCFNLSAATASSSIKISTDTKRAIITSVKIAEGKSTYVPAPKLTISPEFAKVASNTTKATFAVTSNTKWRVSTTSDWAKISTPSGENNGDVEITFSENTADKERTADIVVKTEDGSITKSFKLTQNAAGGRLVEYTSTFTDKDLNTNEKVMTWTSSLAANNFVTRGVQFGAAKGKFTIKGTGHTSNVKKISAIVSTNNAGNTISATVGGTPIGNTISLKKDNNYEIVFESATELSGDIVFNVNDKAKSVWIKSITVNPSSAN